MPSPTPQDVPGGILADDMGLGKTLSMIASIVTTLASAKSYLDSGDARREGHMRPTPATLVIVPSSRKSKACDFVQMVLILSVLLDNWLEEIKKYA